MNIYIKKIIMLNQPQALQKRKKKKQHQKVEAYKNQFYKFVLISLVWFVLSVL